MKLLILGGTGEARALADRLVELGHEVTSSLAGRTATPLLPKGAVRMGGFGGATPLANFLAREHYALMIDATHPFATKMSAQANFASELTGIPLIRLVRPQWQAPEGAHWQEFDSAEEALLSLPVDARPFLALGHKELAGITDWPEAGAVVRLIEPPRQKLPDTVTVLLKRPPYLLKDEIALMQAQDITHLVTKNSGGEQTRAKLDAAHKLGLPVLMIRRPELPPAEHEVTSVEAALALIQDFAS